MVNETFPMVEDSHSPSVDWFFGNRWLILRFCRRTAVFLMVLLLAIPGFADPGSSEAPEEEDLSPLEVSFFSSPKVGGGNLTQGFVRYSWSDSLASRIGISYATETYNAEFVADDIDDSLILVTNNQYRLNLVPLEWTRGNNRLAVGFNTTLETSNEYGFYATTGDSVFDDDIIAFEENRSRLFLSPRVGWGFRGGAGSALEVSSFVWVAPVFGVLAAESFNYRSGAQGTDETETVDGFGVGFPEIEVDFTLLIARRLQLEFTATYRKFSLEEIVLDFGGDNDEGDVFFVNTDYDALRLLGVAAVPVTLPNESRVRVGAGVLLYMERDLSAGSNRLEPGFTVLFGVEP